MRFKLILFIFSFCFAHTGHANGLKSNITYQEDEYQLCNQFTIRYRLIFKIAYVGLYLPNCSSGVSPLDAPNKIMRFKYLVNVNSETFKDSAKEFYLKNANTEIINASQAELDRFNASYQDISSGDYYDLVHLQNKDLQLYKNNTFLSKTDNEVLARNYFNIWFGEIPVIAKMKKVLSNTSS